MAYRVLVVDDEPAVRRTFELALEDSGYEVVTAASGEEGLARFDERRPAVVFLDLKMPGLGGVEVLRSIRERDREVIVYIVTAFYREFFDELKGAAQDGLGFELLQKPVGLDEISEVAQSAVRSAAITEAG